MDNRKSCVFYGSWLDAIETLPRGEREDALLAILHYALGREEDLSLLSPVASALLLMAKEQIDVNNRRYENGYRGGRPKNQTITKQKPNNNQTITKPEPNVNDNDNVNVNDNDNVNDNIPPLRLSNSEDKSSSLSNLVPPLGEVATEVAPLSQDRKEKISSINPEKNNKPTPQAPRPTKRFVKPTVEEIAEYCRERNNSVNPDSFFNFYESKGWLVGKSPMKDWKAAVRTWEQREIISFTLDTYRNGKNDERANVCLHNGADFTKSENQIDIL